jgi:hypothetical protein
MLFPTFPRHFIQILAKIPDVAQDSIRNEGTREINSGIIYK